MKNYLFLFVFLITFSKCKRGGSSYEFNDKGEIIYEEKYDAEDKLIRTIKYYERKPELKYKEVISKQDYDSVLFFYDNGKIFKHGKHTKEGKRFGVWDLYDKNGNKREIREWFCIKGRSVINRVWFLDNKGDTLAWRYEDVVFKQNEFKGDSIGVRSSSYDEFVFNRDTISIEEPIRAYAYCGSPLLEDKGSQIMVLIGKSETPFNKDFSNEDKVKLDTFYNLTIDVENQKWFEGAEKKYFTTFGYYFETPGEKTLRGYMLEYAVGNFENNMDSIIHRKYFEKKIYVKDTI